VITRIIPYAITTALLLTSCGGSGKIRDIVDFTPKLTQETKTYKVSLSTPQPAQAWTKGADWINTQPQNFSATVSTKLAKHNVARSRIVAAPVIADGKIFTISANGILSAVSCDTYKTLWSADLNTGTKSNGFSGGGMVYRDGILYLTHTTRDMIAFDTVSGRELWRRQLPDVTKAQPVLYQNVALVMTISNQLYAVDINNGRILWENNGLAETLSPNRNVAPIIHEGRVIVGYSSGQLMILNLANGEELWQMNFSNEGGDILPGYMPVGLESQPIVDGKEMYVATGNGLLVKINLENGIIEWQKKVQDIQAMNKSGNTLFVATNAKQVAAIDSATGQIAWATDLDPVIDGKKKTKRSPTHFQTPLIINNELVIISSDGKMRILSAETGMIIRAQEIEKGAQFVTVTDKLNIFTKQNVLN